MVLKDFIKLKSNISDLIRVGPKNDGGYVVNKSALQFSEVLYTYGVGWTYDFEKDYVSMFSHKKVHMYDPTIDPFEIPEENIKFYLQGLHGYTENKTSFDNHLLSNGDENSKIFLKIDVEGAEYDFFKFVNLEKLKNVVGMVIEFHELNSLDNLKRFLNVIHKINEKFDITHIHGNNHTSMIQFNDGSLFPSTPEISFLRKDLNEATIYENRSFPLKDLDYPNAISLEDQKFSL